MTRFQYIERGRYKLFTDDPAVSEIAIPHARRSSTKTLYGKTLSWIIKMNSDEAQAVQDDLQRRGIDHTCRIYSELEKRNNFLEAHSPVNMREENI